MPEPPDALDTRLRALTQRAFDDAVRVRSKRGRLATPTRSLRSVSAVFAVVVAFAVVTLPALWFHQGSGVQGPASHGKQPSIPTAPPTAGPLPAQPTTLYSLLEITDIAVDATGNLYIAEGYLRRVVKVSRDGVPSLLAGPARPGTTPNEGGPAVNGIFGDVLDVAVDKRGNVYVLDGQLGVRRISPDATISTLARANGSPAYAEVPGVGGKITATASGTVYVACGECHPPGSQGTSDVYAITPDGSVRVVAGGDRPVTGAAAAGLVHGAAGSTLLSSPIGVAVDARGDVFIADTGNNRIREIGADGRISTVAGSDRGVGGHSGDGGPATQALLDHPVGIAVDGAGDLFILDRLDNKPSVAANVGPIPPRKVSAGIIRTVDPAHEQFPAIGAPLASDAVKAFFKNDHVAAFGPDGTWGIVF
jgi:hypothetical protein